MAKRLTDSRKWDDTWYIGLSAKYQHFWNYMCDKCDHAGLFKPSLDLAGFLMHTTFDTNEIMDTFEDRIIILNDSKWFIPKFIRFQYRELNIARPVCKSVIDTLKLELPVKLYLKYVLPLIIPKSLGNDCLIIKSMTKSMTKSKERSKKDYKTRNKQEKEISGYKDLLFWCV